MKTLTWGEICTLEYGKALRDYADVESDEDCFRVFGTNGPIGWSSKALSAGPGTIVGRKGAYRGVHFSEFPFFVIDTAYYLVPRDATLCSKWAYYKLLTVDLDQVDVGSAIPTTNREAFYALRVNVPHSQVQQRIAAILSAYDDAIENNRRRMALLEKAARLLYEEWFVRLRFPGHEHTPVKDGVPEGWEPTKLSDLIDITHGCAFSGDHFCDTPTSRVLTTPGSFRIGGGFKTDKAKYYCDDGPLDRAYELSSGDLIVTMTDLSVMSDTLGYPAIIPESDGVTYLHNQRVGKVVPLTDWFPKHFLFFVMCDPYYRCHVLGSATGTSVKHTAPKRIVSYPYSMPKRTLVDRFEESVAPNFEQLSTLLRTNQKLRAARDLLLPRLMSGEIEVSN
jgi:type I restriction enzyme S subunit